MSMPEPETMAKIENKQRNWLAIGLVALVAIAAAAYVGLTYFAPEGSTALDEDASAGAATLASGSFSRADSLHNVQGTVSVQRDASGVYFLRFEDYEATDGPDVFFYVVEKGQDPASANPETYGMKVLAPGGADGGEATLRGNFNVPLPAGFDAARYGGVAVWCDQFNVLFGSATLA
ncbi:MAG: DM13 domain-containing protein [Methanobacteriota archaeon]